MPTQPIGLKMNFGIIFVLLSICKNICAVPPAHTDLLAVETDGGSATSIVGPMNAGEEEDLVEVQKTVDEELVNSSKTVAIASQKSLPRIIKLYIEERLK